VPDIGATLREARLRQKLDITQVEAATKIRAKYLRALEHEDWDVLPGPTFVRTFLRSYAEYLGLDARGLVEEYRLAHERAGAELAPIAPGLAARRERRRMRPILTPGILLAVGAVLLVGALYLLGTWGPDDAGDEAVAPTPTPRAQPADGNGEREERRRRRRRPARPRTVSVQVLATGPVYVCLENAAGEDVIDQVTLQAGQRRGPFRSRRFRVTFGNGAAEMRVSGRRVQVPESDEPIAYDLRAGRRARRLASGAGPTCE